MFEFFFFVIIQNALFLVVSQRNWLGWCRVVPFILPSVLPAFPGNCRDLRITQACWIKNSGERAPDSMRILCKSQDILSSPSLVVENLAIKSSVVKQPNPGFTFQACCMQMRWSEEMVICLGSVSLVHRKGMILPQGWSNDTFLTKAQHLVNN